MFTLGGQIKISHVVLYSMLDIRKYLLHTPTLCLLAEITNLFIFIQLADGMEFSFTDKRRFAKVRLLDNVICETVSPFADCRFYI